MQIITWGDTQAFILPKSLVVICCGKKSSLALQVDAFLFVSSERRKLKKPRLLCSCAA